MVVASGLLVVDSSSQAKQIKSTVQHLKSSTLSQVPRLEGEEMQPQQGSGVASVGSPRNNTRTSCKLQRVSFLFGRLGI